ncbi:MAG: DUF4783 domain-containing protein [Flavobacteriales bacterium]|nr:DUF4783 domain-containing protein [Flavobacteriales bacterium]
MKRLVFILFLFISQISFGQNEVLNSIKLAMKTGSANELSKYFDSNIDLKIMDKANSYSSSQAKLILKDFFDSHRPESFHVVHEGNSANDIKYYIGTLKSKSSDFRVYIYLRGNKNKVTIQEISIEEEE